MPSFSARNPIIRAINRGRLTRRDPKKFGEASLIVPPSSLAASDTLSLPVEASSLRATPAAVSRSQGTTARKGFSSVIRLTFAENPTRAPFSFFATNRAKRVFHGRFRRLQTRTDTAIVRRGIR